MQAVEAVNTVKVIAGLNKMAALLKVCPGPGGGAMGRLGGGVTADTGRQGGRLEERGHPLSAL